MMFETWLKSDLKKPVKVIPLSGNLFTADNQANKIGVEILDEGQPATLSGSVIGYIIRADGDTVVVTGTLSGNKASIVLSSPCYAIVGHISIVVKVGATTVGACTSYVYRSTTDTVVDPEHIIPSIDELLAQINNCINATTSANTAAENANQKATAANSAASAANTAANNANQKATAANNAATAANEAAGNANQKASAANNAAESANQKATAANEAASAANTAATKIDNMTVAASALPAGSAPTAGISEVSGHKHIAFGIPKGEKGKDFHIAFTFASIAEMNAYSGAKELYDFAMIDTGSVEDADTGKLYCYESDNTWHYIGDLSGAQGIKGEKGDDFTYADFTESQKAELVQGPILTAQTAAVTAVNDTKASAITAVNEAGSAQVQAVNAKGQEVMESIPSDYSTMSEDVDNLKTNKADKADTVLDTTLSHGRKSGTTVGINSIAYGNGLEASGAHSAAFNTNNKASGFASTAIGQGNTASGQASHAEGQDNVASGYWSHAEGGIAVASGPYSHAEGAGAGYYDADTGEIVKYPTTASGTASHAEGMSTVANHRSQHAAGEYNIPDPSSAVASQRGTYVEIIGNGTDDNARSNARTLDWSGNEELAGDLVVKKGATDEVSVLALKAAIDALAQRVTQLENQ